MPKYKVGDVAAQFPKPELSTSEVSTKLQSLFKEFHVKRNKSSVQFPQKLANNKQEKKKTENDEKGDQRNTMKNKKRKFSALNNFVESSETSDNRITKKFKKREPEDSQRFQNNKDNKSSLKHIPESYKTPVNKNIKKFTKNEPKDAQLFQNKDDKGKNNSFIERDFPRRKKKEAKFSTANNFENNKVTQFSPQNHHFVFNDAPNMYDSKKTNQISGFIKKSKHQKYNATNSFKNNNSSGSENSKVQNLEAFDTSSISFNSENKECTKRESKKQKKHKKDFMLDSHLDIKKPGFVKVPKEQVRAFDDSDTLFKSENKRIGGKQSKNQRKQNVQIDTSKLKEPDFIKIPENNLESNLEPESNPRKPKTDEERAEQLTRTVFIANLPTNTTRKALKKLFSTFGPVEGMRFNPIETDKSKIHRKGNPKAQNLHYAAESLPGFVVFQQRQSALDALSLSGSVFKDRHITVDLAMAAGSQKLYDGNRSIFIGNLSFDVKDESVWDAFGGCGKIEGVRVVRDRSTGIGKGFGYVLFTCVQSKENALALENVEIEGRTIRIKPVDSNKKTQNKLDNTSSTRDSFKSKAIKIKKSQQNGGSRKSIKKIMKRQKNLHNKKKIASILQKSMK